MKRNGTAWNAIVAVFDIQHQSQFGSIEKRNALALRFFAPKANRKITFDSGVTVETYWDAQVRSYRTLTTDSSGNQVGDSDYTGCVESASITHAWALSQVIGDGLIGLTRAEQERVPVGLGGVQNA